MHGTQQHIGQRQVCGWELLFRPSGAGSFSNCTHGLRRGLYSIAALRLRWGQAFAAKHHVV